MIAILFLITEVLLLVVGGISMMIAMFLYHGIGRIHLSGIVPFVVFLFSLLCFILAVVLVWYYSGMAFSLLLEQAFTVG